MVNNLENFTKSYLEKYKKVSRKIEENFINLHPIQAGGKIPNDPNVLRIIMEFLDGYSTCDYCLKGRLDEITVPPIQDLHIDLAKFCGMETTRITPGCRQAQYAAIHALTDPGDVIIIDSLAHYTTYLCIERARLNFFEIPHSGAPEYKLDCEKINDLISESKSKYGKKPKIIFLTHVDYNYGNMADVKEVSKIAHENEIPFMVNVPTDAEP